METLLVCLLAGYGVWLAAYLLWEKRQTKRPMSESDVALPKHKDDMPDIVGKSCFRMKPTTPKAIISTPQTITGAETESATEKASTFVPETEKRHPARLTDEELDAAFEHLEIPDVPLEYEDEEPPEDEEMSLDAGRAYATGVSFDEIATAMKVATAPSATDDERRRAGKVFGELEGTELFNRLTAATPVIASKIAEMIDAHFSQPSSPDNDVGTRSDTDGFDIRDFV